MNVIRPRVLMVGPWPPTHGGVTTFMHNVVSSPLKEKYDFIPFTTSRPAKRNVKGDNYGYIAVFRGGLKRVAQGIFITLWHLAIYPWIVALRRPAVIQVQASDFQAAFPKVTANHTRYHRNSCERQSSHTAAQCEHEGLV